MDDIDYIALGKRLKTARTKRGYSIKELSGISGLSEQHISNLESGRDSASVEAVVALANSLQVSLDLLLFESLIPDTGYRFEEESLELSQTTGEQSEFVRESISLILEELAQIKHTID